jgi:oligoendopeptidase F
MVKMFKYAASMALLGVTALSDPVNAAEHKATENVVSQRMDLTEIYQDELDFMKDYNKCIVDIESLEKLKGTLGISPSSLQFVSDKVSQTKKLMERLMTYAMLKNDEDYRIVANQERYAKLQKLADKLHQASSFYPPELIAMGSEKVETFIKKNRGLKIHTYNMRRILGHEAHTLNSESEKILAHGEQGLGVAYPIYERMASTAVQWNSITILDGEKVKIDNAGYYKYWDISNVEDRKKVWETYWHSWGKLEPLAGKIYETKANELAFQAKSRGYASVLESLSARSNVPSQVLITMVEVVNEQLPTLHRFLKLRQRILGLEKLNYYDMALEVSSLQSSYSISDAKTLTLAALVPFGEEYTDILESGFSKNWMDVEPREGKSRANYTAGEAYDVHPYVLLNFTNDYESVGTFAHEWGHAVHTTLAKKDNSYETFSAPTYTAELASTTNEVMLQEYMSSNATSNDKEQLFFIYGAINKIHGAFFRMAMYGEFEMKLHQVIEDGGSLTGEKISAIYLRLLKKYYGHEQGIMNIADLYGIEWAAHTQFFYRTFYVYKYATSLTGAVNFVERMLDGDKNAPSDFVKLLRAGASQHPYDLLKNSGVDLATKNPYQMLIKRMNRLMDEAEVVMDRMGN